MEVCRAVRQGARRREGWRPARPTPGGVTLDSFLMPIAIVLMMEPTRGGHHDTPHLFRVLSRCGADAAARLRRRRQRTLHDPDYNGTWVRRVHRDLAARCHPTGVLAGVGIRQQLHRHAEHRRGPTADVAGTVSSGGSPARSPTPTAATAAPPSRRPCRRTASGERLVPVERLHRELLGTFSMRSSRGPRGACLRLLVFGA